MAEGMTRLSQHVVGGIDWGGSDRLSSGSRLAPLSERPISAREPSELHFSDFVRTVETDIIPRLALARRQDHAPAPAATDSAPRETEIRDFAQILLAPASEDRAAAFVEAIRARGLAVEDLYLKVFQPAARHIGDLWIADICGFVEVTLALGTLQRLLRDLSPAFREESHRFDANRQALLAPMPGDQHTFGLSMVAEFFRRSAWGVWTAPLKTRGELGETLRGTWFTVVGFTVASEDRLDELAATIRVVRRESCNSAVGVLVGGAVFVDHPDYVARVGADVMGLDAKHAVFQAECFANQLAGR